MSSWKPHEDEALRATYPDGGVSAARRAIPTRSDGAITNRAALLGLRSMKAPTPRGRLESWEAADLILHAAHREWQEIDRRIPGTGNPTLRIAA